MGRWKKDLEQVNRRIHLIKAFDSEFELPAIAITALNQLPTEELEVLDEVDVLAAAFAEIFTLKDEELVKELKNTSGGAYFEGNLADQILGTAMHLPFIHLETDAIPKKFKGRNLSSRGIYSANAVEFRYNARGLLIRRVRLQIWTKLARDRINAVHDLGKNSDASGAAFDREVEDLIQRNSGWGNYL